MWVSPRHALKFEFLCPINSLWRNAIETQGGWLLAIRLRANWGRSLARAGRARRPTEMTTYRLTHIVYSTNTGEQRLSLREFHELGVMERVQTLMNPHVRFYSGSLEVSAKEARDTLRRGA